MSDFAPTAAELAIDLLERINREPMISAFYLTAALRHLRELQTQVGSEAREAE